MTGTGHHRELTVDDGRGGELLVRQWGPEDAPAVIHHHGTPSSSLAVPGGWTSADDLGIRIVTFDRPGYARSSGWPGRTIADAADWTERIADHLRIDSFAVMGTSGGGPHAAATAARLGSRVRRLCVSVGLGPVGIDGFDGLAGLPADTRREIAIAQQGEAELRAFVDSVMAGPGLALWLDQLPPSDREILGRPEVVAEEAAEDESWSAVGFDGWIEDDLATYSRSWGCDVSAISVPTVLLYGGSDFLVPVSHGEAYARLLPQAHLITVPDAGHWMRDHEPAVLRWLVGDDDGPPRVLGAHTPQDV